MKQLRIGILDLVTKAPTRALYARVMNPNMSSIMPQALAVWCEEAGHDVHFICYTGFEDLLEELPEDLDILFIGAFTHAALLSYAISNMFRQRGVVTVLGGPHARCYPGDAQKYFDYVLGFTDQALIGDVLADCSQHRPMGQHLSARQQPRFLPGVKERWKFTKQALDKTATSFKIVPMIGSLGCPYTCSFCIDSVVDYQPLSFDQIREDLRFVHDTIPNPIVGWHDPNFGVRFNDYLAAIEDSVPQGKIRFIAESSLSLLSEEKVKRLARNGFKAILPGIESWYEMGNKSKTGNKKAREKLDQVVEHINMIMRYIPYMQANFVLGMDTDQGAEPFELTKEFLRRSPGSFPAYSLLSAFGEAAPLNLDYQRDGRVIGFPFRFLNNNQAMNVRPQNYTWPEFYDHLIDLMKFSFSPKTMYRRFCATNAAIPRWLNIVRGISSEGYGRIKYHTHLRGLMDTDRHLRRFLEQETDVIPDFYINRVKQELGAFWHFLPDGALAHDQNAYLKKSYRKDPVKLSTVKRAIT